MFPFVLSIFLFLFFSLYFFSLCLLITNHLITNNSFVENKGLEPLTPCVQGRCSKPTELIPREAPSNSPSRGRTKRHLGIVLPTIIASAKSPLRGI